MESNQILVLRDNAKNELMKIQSVEDGITYLNKLKSIDVWVKAEKKDAELQNIIAEQKLRTQRVLGELIADGQRKGTMRVQGASYSQAVYEGKPETLSEIGLTAKQSSTFQAIASIPEEDFEEFIQEKKEAVNNAVAELTTTGAVRLAKSLKEINEQKTQRAGEEVSKHSNQKIKELAELVNATYTPKQRAYLISLINQ